MQFQPPPSSSRPPVTGYKITHNTTGSVLVNQTSYALFPFVGVAPGVYLVSVQAVNALGDEKAETLTVFGILLLFMTRNTISIKLHLQPLLLILTMPFITFTSWISWCNSKKIHLAVNYHG